MKAQSEILVFMLLFLLSIMLFTISVYWGKDIFQRNVDMAKVSSAEKFMKETDYSIKSLVKSEGYQEIDYNVDGPIRLLDDKTVEVRTVITSDISIPTEWNNISSDSSYISERLDGDVFRVQLTYPETETYRIKLFTDGSNLSNPQKIRLEKNSTYYENGKLTIKIRITFV